jgi:hypothetical protein
LLSYDPPLFVFNLDLLPEEIFGTEEVPEYILSETPRRNKGQTTNCVAAFGI